MRPTYTILVLVEPRRAKELDKLRLLPKVAKRGTLQGKVEQSNTK